MGEYIATLVVDNEPIELFLWSRPVWMKQTEAGLARMIPTDPDHILTDALAFYVLRAFDELIKDPTDLVELEAVAKVVDLDEIRQRVYELDASNFEIIIQFDGFENEFESEIAKLRVPPIVRVEGNKVSSIPEYYSVNPFSG